MKTIVEFKKTVKKTQGGYDTLSISIEDNVDTLTAAGELAEKVRTMVNSKL